MSLPFMVIVCSWLSGDAKACNNRFERISGPLSSCRSPQAALKCSYRSDRVTRHWPVALRVRAAKSGTLILLATGQAEGRCTHVAELITVGAEQSDAAVATERGGERVHARVAELIVCGAGAGVISEGKEGHPW